MSPRKPRGKEHFGKTSAHRASPEEVVDNHLVVAAEKCIKAFRRKDGATIIVGSKGSGKTDLRRWIESKATTGFVFAADQERPAPLFEKADTDLSPVRLKHPLALMLVDAMLQRLSEDKPAFSSLFTKLRTKGGELLKSVVENIEIEAGVPFTAKIKLKDIAVPTATEVVHQAWREAIDAIVKDQSESALLLLDDVDVSIPEVNREAKLLEGLFLAIQAINDHAGADLHALAFVKYGHWRNVFDNPTDYDWVQDKIEFLLWDPDALEDLVATRIASIYGDKHEPGSHESRKTLWAKEFEAGNAHDYAEITEKLTRLSVNGPRDVIDLCNRAGEVSGKAKITVGAIDAILPAYSESKIGSIAADFGDSYPKLHRFIKQVFRGAPQQESGTAYRQLVDNIAYQEDNRIDKTYRTKECEWYSYNDAQGVVHILYEVGFLGIVEEGGTIYSMQNPHVTEERLLDEQLEIHPAFRPLLGRA